MKKQWKTVKGFDMYQVSTEGKVISHYGEKPKYLKPAVDAIGYNHVRLYKEDGAKLFKLHRLVAEHFLENPKKLRTINHKNGDKTDNRVENLEWLSHSDNVKHAWKIGLNTGRKITLSDEAVKDIVDNYIPYKKPMKYFGQKYGVSVTKIRNVLEENNKI